MKKITLGTLLFSIILLASCSSKQKKAADSFLSAIKGGDFEKAETLSTASSKVIIDNYKENGVEGLSEYSITSDSALNDSTHQFYLSGDKSAWIYANKVDNKWVVDFSHGVFNQRKEAAANFLWALQRQDFEAAQNSATPKSSQMLNMLAQASASQTEAPDPKPFNILRDSMVNDEKYRIYFKTEGQEESFINVKDMEGQWLVDYTKESFMEDLDLGDLDMGGEPMDGEATDDPEIKLDDAESDAIELEDNIKEEK